MSKTTLTHWGAFDIEVEGDEIVSVTGLQDDPDPSAIGQILLHRAEHRVLKPSVRSSWIEAGPFAAPDRRGTDPFVEVSWDEALDLAAAALEEVRSTAGNEAIFGGSYGWASAGRLHHAPSQLKRFLNCIGGFVPSVGSYSHGAAEAVVPRILGVDLPAFLRMSTRVHEVVEQTELFVSFGGYPAHNTQISSGGDAHHWYRPELRRALDRGCRFVSISPDYGDFDTELDAQWVPIRPGTDAALMLGLCGEIVKNGDHSVEFLERYCAGVDPLLGYLAGDDDGVVKDAQWAAETCGLDPDVVAQLAVDITNSTTTINATWSTQRVENGEQAVWALIALGAVVGQIQTPGGGIAFGYGSVGSVGENRSTETLGFMPVGQNPVNNSIPVARIADALLHPGEQYRFNGTTCTYPNIDLIYWSGGNPFHHHQDLNRLDAAWSRASAVIVNEPFWTATAARADIVFPATIGMERDDFGGAWTGPHLVSMEQVIDPVGEAKDDHAIFAALAQRMGCGEAFTEGRTVDEWLEWLYNTVRETSPELPDYQRFRSQAVTERPLRATEDRFAGFLSDPFGKPLETPSGRIELALTDHHQVLGPDGASHPAWVEPVEWVGAAGPDELHLITPMPKGRLHSQYAFPNSDLPTVMIHPSDAAAVGLQAGDLARIWNDRGECFAHADVSDRTRERVARLENGAWLTTPDPETGLAPRHGNPNTVTMDRPTSVWAQATAAHSCLVHVEPAPSQHGGCS